MSSAALAHNLPYSEVFDFPGYSLKKIHNTFVQKLKLKVGKIYSKEDEKWIMYILLKVAYPAHAGQFRDEGPPYIIHPLEVALEALVHEEDAEVVCAALLHDTLEDTYLKNMSRQQLVRTFHSKVLELHTELLSKIRGDKELPIKEYLTNLKKDPVTVRVKCYDRIVNLRSFGRMVTTQGRRVKRQIKETREQIIPLIKEHDKTLAKELTKITDQLEIRLDFATQPQSSGMLTSLTRFFTAHFPPKKTASFHEL